MKSSGLTINYVPISDSTTEIEPWVNLEQIKPEKIMKYASLRDVYRLWLAAASGQSAQKVRVDGCPIEMDGDTFHVFLGFYAWPSSPELDYELTTSNGTVLDLAVIKKEREFSIFLDNAKSYDLPYYMEDIRLVWESPCLDRQGSDIPIPELLDTSTPIRLDFSSEVFAGLRIYGVAVGVDSAVEIVIQKEITIDDAIPADTEVYTDYQVYESGQFKSSVAPAANLNSEKLGENLACTLTASWIGLDGDTKTEQLDFEIPDCVKTILDLCPNMFDAILKICLHVSDTIVYINGCTAEEIGHRNGPDGQSFCSHITLVDQPSWLPRRFYGSD